MAGSWEKQMQLRGEKVGDLCKMVYHAGEANNAVCFYLLLKEYTQRRVPKTLVHNLMNFHKLNTPILLAPSSRRTTVTEAQKPLSQSLPITTAPHPCQELLF